MEVIIAEETNGYLITIIQINGKYSLRVINNETKEMKVIKDAQDRASLQSLYNETINEYNKRNTTKNAE